MSVTDRVRFTEGDCHYLAFALSRRTGWSVCAFTLPGPGDPDPDIHAFIRMPDGRYLDVDGPQDEDGFREAWRATGMEIRTFDPADFGKWGGPEFGPSTFQRAGHVASRLLREVGFR